MLAIHPSQLHFFLEVFLASAVGAVIGWQRQMHGSPAGLRTHILVCTGAALLTVIDMMHSSTFQGKIAAAVVSGIGFLGAGTIIHSDKGDTVRGLTTAASVWVTAGIGISLGAGGISTDIGLFVSLLVLATLSVVYRIEDFVLRHKRNRSLMIIIARQPGTNVDDTITRIINRLTAQGAVVEGLIKDRKSQTQSEVTVHCQVRISDGFQPDVLIKICAGDADVTQVNWNL